MWIAQMVNEPVTRQVQYMSFHTHLSGTHTSNQMHVPKAKMDKSKVSRSLIGPTTTLLAHVCGPESVGGQFFRHMPSKAAETEIWRWCSVNDLAPLSSSIKPNVMYIDSLASPNKANQLNGDLPAAIFSYWPAGLIFEYLFSKKDYKIVCARVLARFYGLGHIVAVRRVKSSNESLVRALARLKPTSSALPAIARIMFFVCF